MVREFFRDLYTLAPLPYSLISTMGVGLEHLCSLFVLPDEPLKPSLSASPGQEVVSGTNVTLLCWGPSWATRFVLYKEGVEEIPHRMDAHEDRGRFFLTHVTPEHSGNYSCSYQLGTNESLWKQPSDALELLVREIFPRPTLWALPSPVVPKGADVTLRCQGRLGKVTFTLWKTETWQPLQNQNSADLWNGFSFSSVRPEDTGSYRCTYKDRTASGAQSEFSEALDLVVTGEGCGDPRIMLSVTPLPSTHTGISQSQGQGAYTVLSLLGLVLSQGSCKT
uniref:Ig-like domain-containing protein n=1 Tax=Sarcophilus harrisii TaxID=9305 RepID=A0A7N4PH33_SARHA